MIAALQDIEIVLDGYHGITGVDEALENTDETGDIVEVQAGGGLI